MTDSALPPPASEFPGMPQLRRNPWLIIAAAMLLLITLIAVFAPLIAHQDPLALTPSQRLKPPSSAHWFGTDQFGRDVFSRVIYGTRVSLIIGLGVVVLSVSIGVFLGLVSGFIRPLDGLIMRIIDGMMSIPPVLLAIALMALTRGSISNVILAISLSEMPRMVRLVRGVVLSLRDQTYVEAAISGGASTMRIIFRHILPNAMAPIIVQATYIFASAMIVEAILSFIGAGIPPTTPSWGNIMADGRALWLVSPTLIFFPAAFLSITVLAVNVFGDCLRDILDPRSQ